MSIEITFHGANAEHVRAEMVALLGGSLPAPAVYDVSSDNGPKEGPQTTDTVVETVATGKPPRAGRKHKAETVKLHEGPALNVTTTARLDPETPFTNTDQADEAAPEAPAEEAKTYTIDDVRNAATPYIKKHTMAAAQSDLQDCLQAAVGVRKISELNGTDQGQLKKAVEAFEAASKAEARFVKAA